MPTLPVASIPTPTPPPTPLSIADFSQGNASDMSWVQQAFLLTNEDGKEIDNTDWTQRIQTTAAFKFVDTSLGGNWAINPHPQFCRFSDVTMGGDPSITNRSARSTMTTTGSFGMGRYYSEVLDDNAQYLTMSFGIPAFNSLTGFLSSFYDPKVGELTRTGRMPSVWFKGAQLTGELLSLPFYPLTLVGKLIKNAEMIPATSYAYFKPTMVLYWEAVNTIVNAISANLGIFTRELMPTQQLMYTMDDGSANGAGSSDDMASDMAKLHKFLPRIYTETGLPSVNGQRGAVDIFAVATRAQRLSNQYNDLVQQAMKQATSTSDLKARILAITQGSLSPAPTKNKSMSQALTNYYNAPGGGNKSSGGDSLTEAITNGTVQSTTTGGTTSKTTGSSQSSSGVLGVTSTTGATSSTGNSSKAVGLFSAIGSWFVDLLKSYRDNLDDGSNFITFRTDYGGTIGESFSNTMRNSDLEDTINSKVSSARTAEYNFSNGHILGGVAGAALGAVVSSVTDMISGTLSGLQLSGLMALAGAAFVDIPKMYDNSSVSLPTQTFVMKLRPWSGHKLALLQQMYIPLACALAGVMPRATGPSSYNGPFVCQAFARGRMQSRYGMITSLSVTRGEGNVGWTQDGLPLGIDISFEITDFTSMMYMPIFTSMGFMDSMTLKAAALSGAEYGAVAGAAGVATNAIDASDKAQDAASILTNGTYSDDSIFTDYMAVLTGLTFQDQFYPFKRRSIARDRILLDATSMRSPDHWGMVLNNNWASHLVSIFVRGTDRP